VCSCSFWECARFPSHNSSLSHAVVALCNKQGWNLYDDISDAQLDDLEARTKRFERGHAILKQLMDETGAINYVKSLVSVPTLEDDPPKFGPPKKAKRKDKQVQKQVGDLVNMVDDNRLAAIDTFANENQLQWTPFQAAVDTSALEQAQRLEHAQRLALDEEAAQVSSRLRCIQSHAATAEVTADAEAPERPAGTSAVSHRQDRA
jgi:hypothetical protein